MTNPTRLLAAVLALVTWHPAFCQAQATRPASAWNVVDRGAVGDGATDCTHAIQSTIDACTAAGGGTVSVPAGKFLIGAIWLKSNVTLQLDAGAVLLASERFEDFPLVVGRWEGTEVQHHASVINADNAENIAIVGRGTVDGHGKLWWGSHRKRKLDAPRGRLIGLIRCRNVRIEGVTLLNSPSWTVHPVYCDNVTVDGINIKNPSNSPNTDGINPDSCSNVHICNCHIDVGDDCITIKSGKNEDGRRVGRPCENITVTNCTMLAGHGGITIGSEMSGGVNNLAITNCVFDGTQTGIRIKTERGRGGVVQNIRASNLVMRKLDRAISINMFYHEMPEEPVSERTPAFRNIHISGLTVVDCKQAGELIGLAEMPLSEVTISDSDFDAKKGIVCSDARGLELHDVRVNTEVGPACMFKNVENLQIDGFSTAKPHADTAVVELNNVKQAIIRDCSATGTSPAFCKLVGERTAGIVFVGNVFDASVQPFVLDKADAQAVTVR